MTKTTIRQVEYGRNTVCRSIQTWEFITGRWLHLVATCLCKWTFTHLKPQKELPLQLKPSSGVHSDIPHSAYTTQVWRTQKWLYSWEPAPYKLQMNCLHWKAWLLKWFKEILMFQPRCYIGDSPFTHMLSHCTADSKQLTQMCELMCLRKRNIEDEQMQTDANRQMLKRHGHPFWKFAVTSQATKASRPT